MDKRFVSLVAVVCLVGCVGCASDPKEDETDVASGGSGGQAGASAVVGGGGCNEGGAGGEVGQAGAGGTTQVAPFKFDCTDVADGHFVVKAKLAEPIPPGHFAIDGSKIYPVNSGFQNVLWYNLFIADKPGLANVIWDDGKVPTGSRYEFNFGMSADGKTLFETGYPGEKVAINPNGGTSFLPESIYCFGAKELGGYHDGGTTGKLAVSQDGHRVVILTE